MRFGAVLVDQAFPLSGSGLELACRQVVGVAEEFVLAGWHCGCDPVVGVDPAQQVHLVGADLTVGPGVGQLGQVAAGPGRFLACLGFAARQLGVVLGHHPGRRVSVIGV
jgi:hypothetical protein